MDAVAWAGGRQDPQALLTEEKPALNGVQGLLLCPASSVCKPTVLGRAEP